MPVILVTAILGAVGGSCDTLRPAIPVNNPCCRGPKPPEATGDAAADGTVLPATDGPNTGDALTEWNPNAPVNAAGDPGVDLGATPARDEKAAMAAADEVPLLMLPAIKNADKSCGNICPPLLLLLLVWVLLLVEFDCIPEILSLFNI